MRISEECFNQGSWRSYGTTHPAALHGCAFGKAGPVFELSRWERALRRLIGLYEQVTDGSPKSLPELIAADWQIFALNHEQAAQVLSAAADGLTEEQISSATWQLSGSEDDPASRWDSFVEEIQRSNRFHPRHDIDREAFWKAADSCSQLIPQGARWLRARINPADGWLRQGELGPPPAKHATGGRANPAGIPYLYLADSPETCAAEVRASKHETVALGTFTTVQELSVVNLADLVPPDFLDDSPRARAQTYRFLRKLSRALQQPNTDDPQALTYLPTQYVCELLKQGPDNDSSYGGVIYPSCMYTGGQNLVLFDASVAECQQVAYWKVADVQLSLTSVQDQMAA